VTGSPLVRQLKEPPLRVVEGVPWVDHRIITAVGSSRLAAAEAQAAAQAMAP
jgi:hypothetical protein